VVISVELQHFSAMQLFATPRVPSFKETFFNETKTRDLIVNRVIKWFATAYLFVFSLLETGLTAEKLMSGADIHLFMLR